MATVITGISVARFWAYYRTPGMPRAMIAPRYRLSDEPPRAADVDELRDVGLFSQEEDVHVLVAGQQLRRRPKGIVSHSFSGEYPAGALCRVSSDLFVVSPGMCLLQLGTALPLSALTYVCTMFCGVYSTGLDPTYDREGKQSDSLPRTEPVATLEGLRGFLEQAGRRTGSRQALRAVRLSAERARSPMEIVAYLYLCLPPFHGGYALPKPLLNQLVSLDSGDVIESDFIWPRERIALEYFGEGYHASVESMRKDSKRNNAYGTSGFTELVLTAEHFKNFDLLDQIGLFLRERFGKRAKLRDDLRDRQNALRAELDSVRKALAIPRR